MSALNPLAYPADTAYLTSVIALDPAIAGERRVQSLFHIWLKRYFSGASFNTRKVGGTETRTLTTCDLAWQEDVISDSPKRPILHLVIPDVRTQRLDYQPGAFGHGDTWFFHLMVKVTPSLTLTHMPGLSAEHIATNVAGEAQWLLGSSERDALEAHGIYDINVKSPAVILPSGDWKMRLIIFSCRTRRELPR